VREVVVRCGPERILKRPTTIIAERDELFERKETTLVSVSTNNIVC
jgi:hypothetical protein